MRFQSFPRAFIAAAVLAAAGASLAPAAPLRSTFFDGESVVILDPASFGPWGASMTVEAWVHREDAGRREVLLEKGGKQGFAIGLDGGPFAVVPASGKTLDADFLLPASKWFHVAVSWDEKGVVRLYVDGVLRSEGGLGPLADATGPLAIGASLTGDASFAGYIDELRVWKTVKSAAEIRDGMYSEMRESPDLVATFGDGSTSDSPSEAKPDIVGAPSRETYGMLPYSIAAPEIDGAPRLPDFFDGPGDGFVARNHFRPSSPSDARAQVAATEDSLFVGLDSLAFPPAKERAMAVFFFAPEAQGANAPEPFSIAVDPVGQRSELLRFGPNGWFRCGNAKDCLPGASWETATELRQTEDGQIEIGILARLDRGLLFGDGSTRFRLALGRVFGSPNSIDPIAELPAILVAGKGILSPEVAGATLPSTWPVVTLDSGEEPGVDEDPEPEVSLGGTCEKPAPIVLDGRRIALVADHSNAPSVLDGSSCLPLGHPGRELVYELRAEMPGLYRVAAFPVTIDANVAIIVAESCPTPNTPENDCLAASDQGGAGAPEAVLVRFEKGDRAALIVDGSYGDGGGALGLVEVRIEPVLGLPDDSVVAEVVARDKAGYEVARQGFDEVWWENPQTRRLLGTAAPDALTDLERAGNGVREFGAEKTAAGPQPEPPTLSFDRYRYDLEGDRLARLALRTDPSGLAPIQKAFIASESHGDIEAVELAMDGGVFRSIAALELTTESTAPFDGKLSVSPGDMLAALWQDARRPDRPEGQAVGTAMVAGRAPAGRVDVIVDPSLLPANISVPGRAPGEPARPVAAIADDRGAKVLLGLDQLIFTPRDDAEEERFLDRYGAKVVERTQGANGEPADLLVRFDPESIMPEGDAIALLEFLDAEGELVLSDPRLLGLLGVWAAERLRGSRITPNFAVEYHSQPSTNDGENAFGQGYVRDCLQGLQRAWMYVDLYDFEKDGPGTGIRVGVIDSNFCPGIGTDADVVGGHDLFHDRASPFGEAETFGFGRPFHGTAVATSIGSRPNNGTGVTGTAGLVADMLLYNIGGFGFLYDVDNAIRRAVDDGARVINMSIGFPCKISFINFCKPANVFLCIVIGPIIDLLVPVVPFPAASLGCIALTAAMSVAKSQIKDAAEFAVRRDVVLVASAGNSTDHFGPSPIEDFHIVPAILPEVIACGVTDSSYRNTEFFGRKVEAWALTGARSFAPSSSCTGSFLRVPFGQTSSASATVSAVVAMMRKANPSLRVADVRSIIAASAVSNPGGDPRVTRFLRADVAVIVAGSRAASPLTDPRTLFPALAFDEIDGTISSTYGPTGSCAWPPVLRGSNDSAATAETVAIDFRGSGPWRWTDSDLGAHDFTSSGDLEEDWFRIPAVPGGSCDIFDVAISVEQLDRAGFLFPEVEGFDRVGRVRVLPRSGTTRVSRWEAEGVFLDEDILFRVAGDDNLYNVTVEISNRRAVARDRFEPNGTPAEATDVEAEGLEYRELSTGLYTTWELVIDDLNFHCPDDRDFFTTELPTDESRCLTIGEGCLDLEDTLCPDLEIATTGPAQIVIRDSSGREFARGRNRVVIPSPRTLPLIRYRIELSNVAETATEYQLIVRYRVPRDGDALPEMFTEIDEWACCALHEMRDCHDLPGGGGGGGGGSGGDGDRFIIDTLDVARIIGGLIGRFDARCPMIVCDPAPTMYHLTDLRDRTDFIATLATEGGFRDGVRFELIDLDHQVVASGVPQPFENGHAGDPNRFDRPDGFGASMPSEGDRVLWLLSIEDLEPGIYFVRLRGLDFGEYYTITNLDPSESLPEPEPLATPVNVEVETLGPSALEVSWEWTPDAGAEMPADLVFVIARGDSGADIPVEVGEVSGESRSFIDRELRPVTEYFYSVRARSSSRSSRWSELGYGQTDAGTVERTHFRRADINQDGRRDIADAIATLHFLFQGGATPACLDAADSNNDAAVNITDAVFTLGWLFTGGSPPPAPFDCGPDSDPVGSRGDLGCARYAPCE